MLEILMVNILRSSLIASFGIILLIILKKSLFKEYNQSFNYYIWLSILLIMVTPFKIPITLPERLIKIHRNNYIKISINNFASTDSIFMYNYSYSELNALKIIFYIWSLGLIIFIIYKLFNYWSFLNRIKSLSQSIYDENINNIYLNLQSNLNIKRNISLYYCEGISIPLGIGILNPMILLPRVKYSTENINWILKHELIHHKKYDILYKIFMLIAMTLHWFNPLVYIMCKLINHDCELSCDEDVLKNCSMYERKKYALTLVDSIEASKKNNLTNTISTGFNNKKTLKRRLENMFDTKVRKKGFATIALVGVLSISSIISVKTFAKEDIEASGNVNSDEYFSNLDIYDDFHLNSNNYLKENPQAKAQTVYVYNYTYENAPQNIKTEYEENCSLVGVEPSNDDSIGIFMGLTIEDALKFEKAHQLP